MYNFSKLYKYVKKKNNLEQKQMLEEIQGLYKNKDISSLKEDKFVYNSIIITGDIILIIVIYLEISNVP